MILNYQQIGVLLEKSSGFFVKRKPYAMRMVQDSLSVV